MKRDVIIPLCVLLILMSAGAAYACGPFFAASYLVDGTERDGLVMTMPKSDFAMSVACIYTNQPPVQTNLFCAAYARGRACLDKREFADAIGWFEQCRKQARKHAEKHPGCADRSTGWMALAELHRGDYAACIRHYYECGDRRSLVSYVLPAIARRGLPAIDRIIDDDVALRVLAAYHHTMAATPGWGEPQHPDAYFHYEAAMQPSPEEARAAAAFVDNLNQALAARGKKLPTRYDDVLINVLRRRPDRYAMKDAFEANPETLTGIVRDETCRRVLVAWIVARSPFENLDYGGISVKLLAAVETALTNQQVADVDGILRLAYNAGDYDAAERWLALSDKQSVITQWIESKLLLRQGRFDDARDVLRRLLPSITPASDAAELCNYDNFFSCKEKCRVAEMVNSEIGLLELNRNDFLMAFDAFVRGKTWEDMAYVAEKVLTCDELDGYLRQHRNDKVLQQRTKGCTTTGTELAYLLARRYLRAGQLDKAIAWMPNDIQMKTWSEKNLLQQCARFVHALTIAKDVRQSPDTRADAYAVAARLATMELIGTETGPDWACYEGHYTKDAYFMGESWTQRYGTASVEQAGIVPGDDTRRAQRITGTKALYHATTAETSRVNAAWPTPCKRFHYRYYAADLAWQGAALLPCNSEKAAQILHEAGCLLMSRDLKAADRFYKEIAYRHGKTELGKRVRIKRWFLQASAWAAYVVNVPLQVTHSGSSAGEYIVVDVSGGPNAASYPVTYQDTAPPRDDTHKTSKIVLRMIPAGSFMMGSPAGELGRGDDETQHNVTLTNDFHMGIYEITQAQYANVTGVNPAYFQHGAHAAKRPVEQVSWGDVRGTWPGRTPDGATFIGKLQSKTGLAFDLPTEAQWEYACRAGTTRALNNNTDLQSTLQDPNMDILGRYRFNGGSGHEGDPVNGGTAAVGSFKPNAWGLYDTHGNVWEWCQDLYGDVHVLRECVLRGGSWSIYAGYCRSAHRAFDNQLYAYSDYGFRLALPAGQ